MKQNIQFFILILIFYNSLDAQTTPSESEVWNTSDYNNHVILLLDRSQSMIDKDPSFVHLNKILAELPIILFKPGRVITDRKLYDQSKHDFFSFSAFNVQAGGNLGIDLISPIERYVMQFDERLLKGLCASQVKKEMFQGLTALTYSKPLALFNLSKASNIKVNRTFFIVISDEIPNTEEDTYADREDQILLNNKIQINDSIKEIVNDFQKSYKVKIRTFETRDKVNEHKSKFESGGIKLRIYELIPEVSSLIRSDLINLPNPVYFDKTPYGYQYILPRYANDSVKLYRISKVECFIQDTFGNKLANSVNGKIEIKEARPGLSIKLAFWVAYNDAVYGRAILHPEGSIEQGSKQLNVEIPIRYTAHGVLSWGKFGSILYRVSSKLLGNNPQMNNWFWIGIFVCTLGFFLWRILVQRNINHFTFEDKI